MNENDGIVKREAGALMVPKAVLARAQEAAAALQGVISTKKKKVIISGEQYLEYEDWLTLAEFKNVTVKTRDALPIEIDGIKGAIAHADLFDAEGKIVGGAEAYCMRDEENWKDRPWFMLASMAQTRAGAKALRNRLAWIAVLAGYKPTPAEEMEGVHPRGNGAEKPQYTPPKSTKQAPPGKHLCRCGHELRQKKNGAWFCKQSDGGCGKEWGTIEEATEEEAPEQEEEDAEDAEEVPTARQLVEEALRKAEVKEHQIVPFITASLLKPPARCTEADYSSLLDLLNGFETPLKLRSHVAVILKVKP